MGQPKLQNKGGMAMWYDATLIVTFGNITNSGTSKIKAIAKGKEYEFAKKTKVQVEKNHINGIQSRGAIVMTQHGFIEDVKKAIDAYKDQYKGSWSDILGSMDFDLGLFNFVEPYNHMNEHCPSMFPDYQRTKGQKDTQRTCYRT